MAKKVKEPQYCVSAINTPMINYRVYYFKPTEKLLFSLLLLVVGGVVSLVFYGGLFKSNGQATTATYISNGVVFLLIGLFAIKQFMPVLQEMFRKRRLNKLQAQFRDFLNSLSNSLSSGMNVADSLINSYADMESQFSAESYIALEVKEMVNGIQNNIPIENMISDFGKRSGVDDIANFAVVFETAYRTGGNLKTIIRRTAEIISEKSLIASEIDTKITSNKTQMNVMLVIPVFVMIMLKSMSSDFAAAFGTIIGAVCITISVGLFFAAYKVGQKIMNIKG